MDLRAAGTESGLWRVAYDVDITIQNRRKGYTYMCLIKKKKKKKEDFVNKCIKDIRILNAFTL